MKTKEDFDYCDFPEEDQKGCMKLMGILFSLVVAAIICGIINLTFEGCAK